MEKKAQNITVSTLIIIVLAIVVLVVLVIGFVGGWGNLWGRITSFFGGANNIDTLVQACQMACGTDAIQDFCSVDRVVKSDKAGLKVAADGKEGDALVSPDTAGAVDVKKGTATCKELVDWYSRFGFESCPEIECT